MNKRRRKKAEKKKFEKLANAWSKIFPNARQYAKALEAGRMYSTGPHRMTIGQAIQTIPRGTYLTSYKGQPFQVDFGEIETRRAFVEASYPGSDGIGPDVTWVWEEEL